MSIGFSLLGAQILSPCCFCVKIPWFSSCHALRYLVPSSVLYVNRLKGFRLKAVRLENLQSIYLQSVFLSVLRVGSKDGKLHKPLIIEK